MVSSTDNHLVVYDVGYYSMVWTEAHPYQLYCFHGLGDFSRHLERAVEMMEFFKDEVLRMSTYDTST